MGPCSMDKSSGVSKGPSTARPADSYHTKAEKGQLLYGKDNEKGQVRTRAKGPPFGKLGGLRDPQASLPSRGSTTRP